MTSPASRRGSFSRRRGGRRSPPPSAASRTLPFALFCPYAVVVGTGRNATRYRYLVAFAYCWLWRFCTRRPCGSARCLQQLAHLDQPKLRCTTSGSPSTKSLPSTRCARIVTLALSCSCDRRITCATLSKSPSAVGINTFEPLNSCFSEKLGDPLCFPPGLRWRG
jgi:hypothetical protein